MYKILHTGKEEKSIKVSSQISAIGGNKWKRKVFGLIHKNKSNLIASHFKSMTTV